MSENVIISAEALQKALDVIYADIGPRGPLELEDQVRRVLEASGYPQKVAELTAANTNLGQCVNTFGDALQKIGTALGLLPGANLTTDCIAAVNALLADRDSLGISLARAESRLKTMQHNYNKFCGD